MYGGRTDQEYLYTRAPAYGRTCISCEWRREWLERMRVCVRAPFFAILSFTLLFFSPVNFPIAPFLHTRFCVLYYSIRLYEAARGICFFVPLNSVTTSHVYFRRRLFTTSTFVHLLFLCEPESFIVYSP